MSLSFKVRAEKIKQIQKEYTAGEEVPQEALEAFQNEIQSLLEEDMDAEINSLDISSFDIEVPAKTISLCMPFITEGADARDLTVVENSDKA